jgi:hypothetical protein
MTHQHIISLAIISILITLSFLGCIEQTNQYSIDTDGDGYIDDVDEFPNNDSEWLDSDIDGIGNNADSDDDNDGFFDDTDNFPYKDATIKLTIAKCNVLDDVNTSSNTSEAYIYFKILINNSIIEKIPNEGEILKVNISELTDINGSVTYNIPDNLRTVSIRIHMYSYDILQVEELDIDGRDDTNGLSLLYYVISQTWIGDDGDGISNGSDDGTQNSDDNDAYLEYILETI